ncbi:MAG: pyridoxal-dependent decarboxylase [Candidatus Ozemobacteraceae bacterium]
MEKIDVNALFLGPKSENEKFFKEMLSFLINDHVTWRQYFHPEDKPCISSAEQQQEKFQATLQNTREVLVELAANLQTHSMPWFSPRYLGHMTTDTLMAANLAYMLSILYNPNNCAYEGSPATTPLEIEVGKQLARLFAYDPQKAWGHITSGGTVANYEGIWIARNLKTIPLALKEVAPDLVSGMSDWELLNIPTKGILDLLDQAKSSGRFDAVRQASSRGKGMRPFEVGKILVPESKHYSWTKAVDILGIGQQNLISIKVKNDYRMDIAHLKQSIDGCISRKEPILAVVAVMGSTEEGAVDEVHHVADLRREYEEQGISFYFHIDAAYGGYARSVFMDKNDNFMDYESLKTTLHEQAIISRAVAWPDKDVYDAFHAMNQADSITVDPHKMGYVPYAAGAFILKDKRVLDLISYFAAYVFEKNDDNPMLLGSYILEGSKSGAVVAAVWAAHQVVPLNLCGYGELIGRSIAGAHNFYNSLLEIGSFKAGKNSYIVKPLTKPDLNIVVFSFNREGNKSLKEMNALNNAIYEKCSYKSGPVYINDFITSKTSLTFDEYDNTPGEFSHRLGIPLDQWQSEHSVFVLRSTVLTPFLADEKQHADYWIRFMNTMKKKIEQIELEMNE